MNNHVRLDPADTNSADKRPADTKTAGRRRAWRLLADILLLAVLYALDQYTKHLAVLRLKGQESYTLMDGVLKFHYLENRGAAFGILQDQKLFFIVIGVIILCLIAYALFRIPLTKRFAVLRFLLVLIAAGAVGNMTDRIRFDYVIDFIYFELIDFPIFNVADCYVTVATVLLFILFLFFYKEEDLTFLNPRDTKPKYRKLD